MFVEDLEEGLKVCGLLPLLHVADGCGTVDDFWHRLRSHDVRGIWWGLVDCDLQQLPRGELR